MRKPLQKFFSFTNREFRGIIILIVLILLVRIAMHIHVRSAKIPDHDYTALDQIVVAQQKADSNRNKTGIDANALQLAEQLMPESKSHREARFDFDPNGLPEEEWIHMGLSPAQAKVIKRYEAKGGRFRTKEDVKKMIVISDRLYAELEPHIQIQNPQFTKAGNTKVQQNQPLRIELNAADTNELKRLPGIGSAFARRIVNFRNKLGGFHHTDQLLEVYGFDQQRFESIRNSITVDSTRISKIDINKATAEELNKHPYLNSSAAKALVNYRQQHGVFQELTDILGCKLIDAELYRKLAPYLKI